MLKRKVLKGLLGVSAVAALFGTLGVQAQTSGSQTTGGQGSTSGQTGAAQGGTASGTGSAASQALSKTDRTILMDLAMANMSEIEAGRMAQNKTQSDQVKNFAQQMIDDHTKALTEVQQLAQTKGVTLPTELDRQHRAKADKLKGLSGEQFDRSYMAQSGVAEHKKTHSMLRQAQDRAKDPDIKALAARLVPTVDQHLNSAQQLHGETSGAKGSSGRGTDKSGQGTTKPAEGTDKPGSTTNKSGQ